MHAQDTSLSQAAGQQRNVSSSYIIYTSINHHSNSVDLTWKIIINGYFFAPVLCYAVLLQKQ
jgi:hypothetical protein